MSDTEKISNEELIQFLDNEELQNIVREYREASEMAESAGFNIFQIISDYYYRENFHGDILMAFLNPESKHGEGDKFLKIFIEMLGVDINNYSPSPVVIREHGFSGEDVGRIDFVIKNNNEEDPHCIIIENKLYDAEDMPKQLPRYYKEMIEGQKNQIDAIVYLPMALDKTPKLDKEDIENIEKILKIIPANDFDGSRRSLVKNWVIPCMFSTQNIDCISILRQYMNLLISLQLECLKYRATMRLREFLCKEGEGNLEKAIAVNAKDEFLKGIGSQFGCQMANRLILNNSGAMNISIHPTCKSCCVIDLKKKREIYLYCGEADFKYRLRVINDGKIDNVTKVPEDCKTELQSRMAEDEYVDYGLNEEAELLKMINRLVNASE